MNKLEKKIRSDFKRQFVRQDGLLDIGKYDEDAVVDFILSKIKDREDEIYKKLKKIEDEKFEDEEHCTCLRYAIYKVFKEEGDIIDSMEDEKQEEKIEEPKAENVCPVDPADDTQCDSCQ